MYNYGVGSNYSYGGYYTGIGYGGNAYTSCCRVPRNSMWSIVLVLFIVLVLLQQSLNFGC